MTKERIDENERETIAEKKAVLLGWTVDLEDEGNEKN
jgi:hypothetical protein